MFAPCASAPAAKIPDVVLDAIYAKKVDDVLMSWSDFEMTSRGWIITFKLAICGYKWYERVNPEGEIESFLIFRNEEVWLWESKTAHALIKGSMYELKQHEYINTYSWHVLIKIPI